MLVKDESTRFGLRAFEALGRSYAVWRLLCRQLGLAWQQADFDTLRAAIRDRCPETMTLTTATDGNHGRGVAFLAGVYKDPAPRFIVVEPIRAACMLASSAAGDGRPHAVGGDLDTIMVGLTCGEPSPPAWTILQAWTCAFISCENYVAANGMRILANPLAGDDPVEAGESGAVGVGLLDLLVNHPACETLRRKLHIGPQATKLVFNTEDATDPANYRNMVWYGKYGG